jgi:hypothetical protein
MHRGSQGPAVATLQAALNFYLPDKLPPLVVNSIFGPETEERVKEFQRRNNLYPNGIVGPETESIIYACGSISVCAFAMRRVMRPGPPPQLRFPSVKGARLSLLPPGGLKVQIPASLVQQMASPFQPPPPRLTPPFTPPFLTPRFSRQVGPKQQVSWPATASSWVFLICELMVLGKWEIEAEIEPEQAKSGSLPGWDINVSGSAKRTLLPDRHRRASLFAEARAKTSLLPEGVTGSVGLGLHFKRNTIGITFGGNSAFDADPEGRAGTEETVPEGSIRGYFKGWF